MKFLPALLLLVPLCASAQRGDFMLLKEKKWNLGVRIGFDASLPIVHSLSAGGEELQSSNQSYRVGYLAAISLRAGRDRVFFNPSFAWHRSESELQFALPQNYTPDNTGQNEPAFTNSISVRSSSLELPLLIGYDLVKSNPYRLSVLVGPKLKYFYKTDYDLDIAEASFCGFVEDKHPGSLSLVAGVDVTIGRLFLDFNYEFGITRTKTLFTYTLTDIPSPTPLEYERRTNNISFALGFLF